jgi:coenzyme Q-binding protein COQ10
VELTPYEQIKVTMLKGPFEHLTNSWKFTEIELKHNKTRIDFAIDFKFRSKILEKLIGSLFNKATNKMVHAFKQRADKLYGKEN